MKHPALRTLALLASTAILAACAAQKPAGFQATLPASPQQSPAKVADGAIFTSASGYAPLYFGDRARRVGDLVTVVMLERTQTRKSASSSNSRDGSFALAPPGIGPFSFNPANLNSGGSSSFNGEGDAAQTSTLRGEITVTIAEVLPGGIARIRGEKVMTLSQGDEWVQLSGLVRFADIDSDNRIASTRIADAQISYAGKGVVQQSSRPGWLARAFNLVSPF